ncbi:Ulp1 protease family, C-terminal catalytic domain [Sesbania bispinosa]|nr:Ulp1 protease family, C-terminal catalytic domain [Sesbania bispinosa]
MAMYHSQKHSRMSKSKSNVIWIAIKCPEQTDGIDCGYFVMRFMKEIITSNQINLPLKYFPDYRFGAYTQQQLIEVKEDWVFGHFGEVGKTGKTLLKF